MDKRTGYLLLALGAAFIIGAAGLLLASFYGGVGMPQPFDMTGDITITLSSNATMSIPMPPQINKAANLSVFFLLVFVLVGVGARLGGLGVKLINKEQPKAATPK